MKSELNYSSFPTASQLAESAVTLVEKKKSNSSSAAVLAEKIITHVSKTWSKIDKDKAKVAIVARLQNQYWDGEKYSSIEGVQVWSEAGRVSSPEYHVRYVTVDGRSVTGTKHQDRGDLMTDIAIA